MTPKSIVVASLVVLAGVFVFGWRAVNQGANGQVSVSTVMNEMYVFDVKDRVRAALRDPSSAVFRTQIMKHPDGSYCGLVSTRNALGGYADPVQFHVSKSGAVTFDSPSDVIEGREGLASRWCREAVRV